MTLFTRKHTISSKRIYEGGIINLRVDELQSESGAKTCREIVEHPGGVVIICQPKPDQVVLIKQYRYSIDVDLLELPAGRIEPGEPPLLCAQRELTEETGYKANKWEDKGSIFSAPGFCNEVLHFFYATDITLVGKQLDEDEETEVILLPLKEAWHLALSGEYRDTKTIAGLAMLMRVL